MRPPDRRDCLRSAGLLLASRALRGSRSRVARHPIGLCRSQGDWAPFAAAGCDYIEVRVTGELMPEAPEEEFAERLERLRKAPLPVRAANSFLPGHLRCTGPKADHAAVLAYAEVAFARARRVGIEVVTFGSSAARSLPEGFRSEQADLQFVSLLGSLGDAARAQGLQLGLEPLRKEETNYLNSLAQADAIVRRVDHPHVGLTADLYHMALAGEGPADLAAAGARVRHVHVAERGARTAPGTAGDDFTGFFEALDGSGYRGLISIESRWSDIGLELPRAVTTLREQMGSR